MAGGWSFPSYRESLSQADMINYYYRNSFWFYVHFRASTNQTVAYLILVSQ